MTHASADSRRRPTVSGELQCTECGERLVVYAPILWALHASCPKRGRHAPFPRYVPVAVHVPEPEDET